VRGSVLRAIDKSIVARAGREVRDRVIEQLPKGYADDFRDNTLTGLILYDLAALDRYATVATELALKNDLSKWRELGKASFDGELVTLLRPVFRSPDVLTLVKRAVTVWSRLFDFGVWTVDTKPEAGDLIVRISDFGPAPVALRQWLIGLVEHTLQAAGQSAASVVGPLVELSRAPDLTLEIHLGAKPSEASQS
jgi:hypothetical protein